MYKELMFEFGEDYLELKCGSFKKVLAAWRQSGAIWNWWINQYYILDEALIHVEKNLSIDLYRAFHVGMDYYPNEGIVKRAMEEYDTVVQNEIKSHLINQ
jgi:hypothetical protein